jgi:putative copper resistance protein D
MIEVASVAVRFALYVDLMLLFGLPLFGLYALRGTERVSGSVLPFRRLIWPLALIGVALSSVALILLAAAMSGVGPGAVDREAIGMVVTGASALRGRPASWRCLPLHGSLFPGGAGRSPC